MTIKELLETYVGTRMIDLDGNECPKGLILSDPRTCSKIVKGWGISYDNMLTIVTE